MNKQEFLNELRNCLDGEVPQSVINENIAYYNQYFAEQTAMGKSEPQIAQELGKPSLLARTIVDASDVSENAYYEEQIYTEDGEDSSESDIHMIEIKWYHKVLIAIVIIAIVVLLLTITGAILSIAGPILLILLIIVLIRRLLS